MSSDTTKIIPIDPEVLWPEPDMSILEPHDPPAPELSEQDFLKIFGPVSGWINDAAEVKGAPPDYVALALLSTASAAIGNTRWASPWEGWREPCIIWAMLVGNPSSGKSPALDAVLDALRPIEEELQGEYRAAKQRWQDEVEVAKIAEADWKSRVKNSIAEGGQAPPKPAAARIEESPIQSRIRITDATTEKIADLLAKTWRGLILQRDELSGWLLSMDRYSNGGDRPFWLEAYGGRSFTVDRKSSPDPIQVECLSVSVLGGIQPEKLSRLLVKTDDDGLLARFLTVYPSSRSPKRPQRDLNQGFMEGVLRSLHDLQPVAKERGQLSPGYLTFTEAARQELNAFRLACSDLEEVSTGPLRSHIGKLPGLAVRIALILVHLDWAGASSQKSAPQIIQAAHVKRSVHYVGKHLLGHAQRAYGTASLPGEVENAIRIAKRVLDKNLREISSRDIQRNRIIGSINAAELEKVMAVLIDLHWVRRKPFNGFGRPSKTFLVNPRVHQSKPLPKRPGKH